MPKKVENEIPEGIIDEDGDEIIDLSEGDDDDAIIDEDIYEIEDEMLGDPTDEDDFGRTKSEVEIMLRDLECSTCEGSSTRRKCKVRDDFGCPPDKADK